MRWSAIVSCLVLAACHASSDEPADLSVAVLEDAAVADGAIDLGPMRVDLGPAHTVPAMVPVSTLVHTSCGGTDADAGFHTTCASVSQGAFDFPATGRYELDIDAYGDQGGAIPQLAIGIDGVFSPNQTVDVEWAQPMAPLSTYVFLLHVTAGTHDVALSFVNGTGGATPSAASLTLGTLAITSPAPPPSPDAVPDQYWNVVPLVWYPVHDLTAPVPFKALPTNQGAAEPTKHVGAVAAPRTGDTLSWSQSSNGYSEYSVVFTNAGAYHFDAWAYGDQVKGAPRMQLAIDGAVLDTVDVSATTVTKYGFTAQSVSAGQHLVEVAFVNDLYGGTASTDRNLVIARVEMVELGPGGLMNETADDGMGGQTGVGTYTYGPAFSGTAQGVYHGFDNSLVLSSSTVYPSSSRHYGVYVPKQVDASSATAFMVFQDGPGFCSGNKIPVVFDALIASGAMPPTILVCVEPGVLSADSAACKVGDTDCERSFEYDSVNDTYFQFVTKDLLPLVTKLGLTLSTDPEQRGAGGGSSGGIAAFTLGWFHPESFRRIYSVSPSFTDIRMHGGSQYPSMVAMKSPIVPLRFTMTAGTHDLDCFGNVGANCQGDPHAWADAAKRMGAALQARGYPFEFRFNSGTHEDGDYALPDALTFIWKN